MAAVHFPCGTCGAIQQLALGGAATAAPCQRCSTTAQPAHTDAGAPSRCAVCGGTALYVQRDFNRKLGLAVVAAAAVLAVPTRGLSLLAAVLADLLLYRLLPRITVCYACDAVHRGVPVHPCHNAFDHHVADAFKVHRAARAAAVRRWRLQQARGRMSHDSESRKRSSSSGG